jgi:hypothetical protein
MKLKITVHEKYYEENDISMHCRLKKTNDLVQIRMIIKISEYN